MIAIAVEEIFTFLVQKFLSKRISQKKIPLLNSVCTNGRPREQFCGITPFFRWKIFCSKFILFFHFNYVGVHKKQYIKCIKW